MNLRCAQVVKEREGRKLVKVHKNIIFGNEDYWLERQMVFYLSFFDFVRPNSGLKLKIESDSDDITNRKYLRRTPMMAVGKTDNIWSLEELLTFSLFQNFSKLKGQYPPVRF